MKTLSALVLASSVVAATAIAESRTHGQNRALQATQNIVLEVASDSGHGGYRGVGRPGQRGGRSKNTQLVDVGHGNARPQTVLNNRLLLTPSSTN